jgi:hypothetical protein
MHKTEFQKAYEIAVSKQSLENVDFDALLGFGRPDFKPVKVPIEAVASVIRWQCCQMNGQIDSVALAECWEFMRRKVTIVKPAQDQYVYANGTPVKEGEHVIPDHYETTFTVTIRSLNQISEDQLKDQIQQRCEVTNIQKTGLRCVVRR